MTWNLKIQLAILIALYSWANDDDSVSLGFICYLGVIEVCSRLSPYEGWFYVATWLGYRMPRCLIRRYAVWEGVLVEINIWIEFVDLVKQIALPNERGLIQSAEGLYRTKRLSKREPLLPDCLWAGMLLLLFFFLPWDSGLKHHLHLGLELAPSDWT